MAVTTQEVEIDMYSQVSKEVRGTSLDDALDQMFERIKRLELAISPNKDNSEELTWLKLLLEDSKQFVSHDARSKFLTNEIVSRIASLNKRGQNND